METAAQTLVGNLGQLLGEEYQLLRGVGSEVADLRDDLATMNALLVMQSEAEDGAVDRFVREWMKQLRELAHDSEDCVDHYKLRVKSRPGDGVLARLKRLALTLLLRRRLACEIRALRARGVTIGERHARYGVNRDALRPSATLPAPAVLAASAHASLGRRPGNEYRLVGITEQADKLVGRLKQQQGGAEQNREVFSLVGFGGVGKTTLADEVCRRLETEFPYQAFVSVSQAFEPTRDLDDLLKRLLQKVTNSKTKNKGGIKEVGAVCNMDGWNQDELTSKLKESLEKKRYLIVIDDVWTVRAWEEIEQALPDNKCGSRIIVTTRIDSVASQCSVVTAHIHHMKPLEGKYSKQLFLSRAFGSMEEASCPDDLKNVLDRILKKCGGLPLAIVSIASVLAGYTSAGSKEKWETVCKSIGSQMETHPTLEGMKHIVTLSYNHLPHELKECMMYLSIFPEDYEINKVRLLCRWIAEGLVQEKRGLTLMEIAESYLDELVSRNMVVPKFSNDGKVKSCRVHDMLLEVMVSKSLQCNFVSLLGGQYAEMSYDRVRRLSIQGGDEQRSGHEQRPGDEQRAQQPKKTRTERAIEGMDKEHVRSFSMFQQSAHKLLDHEASFKNKLLDHLDKFTLLRVLDLEGCQGLTDKHVRCICRLYLLKFLSLKNTNVRDLPPQVGKLEHLQTLDVENTWLGGLPETVTNLEKLENVVFRNKGVWSVLWRLPRGLKKMQALCDVGTAILPDDVEIAKELGELQKLQSLSMYIECTDSSGALLALADSLGKLYSLRTLDISHRHFWKMNFLYKLPKPPQLLRSLRIEGILDEGLPEWVGLLTHLVEMNVHRTQLVGDQLFDVLCKLPNLKSIIMDTDCYRDPVIVARETHRFPVLSNLSVYSDQIEIHFEHGSMEQLETLEVRVGDQNKDLESIRNLPNLKKVPLWAKADNTSLQHAQDQLSAENRRRAESNQFEVVVRYQ